MPGPDHDDSNHATDEGVARSSWGPDAVTVVAGGQPEPEETTAGVPRGSSIGRYVILDVLGQGGMGVVYAAYDPELDRKVAIKVLRAARAEEVDGSGARARLVREAQALARLSHPNVVNVHDVGEAGGEVFVAMEYIEGLTLRAWRTKQVRSQREILDIFIPAGRGLQAAHAAGLVHRDFKPDNVLVGIDGRPRVVDFGLAVGRASPVEHLSDGGGSLSSSSSLDNVLTEAGTVVGTPGYMAPEQHTAARTDAATDQFAFCVALYEALYEERPFAGRGRAVARAACHGDVRPAPAGSDVPTPLRNILLRGLAPRPDERHASMEALLILLSGEPGRARRARGLAVLGIAAVVGLGTVAYLAGAADRVPPTCVGVGEAMDAVWNPPRRAQTRAAFEGAGVAYGTDTFGRVDLALEHYASAWKAGALASCEATHVAQTQSSELLDRRAACLNTRREGMDALLDVFAAADAGIVERATSAVQGLAPIEDCADLATLNRGLAPPSGARMRVAVDALTVARERASAISRAGLFREALVQQAALVERAAGIGYLPAHAQTLRELAVTQSSLGMPEADATTHRAFVMALEAGHDAVAARAAIDLAHAFAIVGHDVALGRQWSAVGEAIARRRGGDTQVELGALNVKALVALGEAREDDARVAFEELLARTRIEGDVDTNVSVALMNLGAFHAQVGELDPARRYLEEAIDVVAATQGPGHPDMLNLKSNLGALQMLDRDYAAARVSMRAVLLLQREAYGDLHPEVARTLERLAGTERHVGDLTEAERLHREALAQQRELQGPDHYEIASTLQNLSLVRGDLGFHEDALRLAREASAMNDRLPSSSPRLRAIARDSVAIHLLSLSRYAEAIPLLEQARAHFSERPADRRREYEVALRIARAHRGLGSERAALAAFERALEVLSRPADDNVSPAWALVGIATSLRALGEDAPRVLALARRAQIWADRETTRTTKRDAELDAVVADLLGS